MADPRKTVQDLSQYQQNRYESQQNPMYDAMAYNYGRGSEANYGDYTDIMNQYRGVANQPYGTGGGGAGGGGGYASVSPAFAGYTDPFKSYAGYEDFSKTGGYSANDIANLRARGTSPVRAAYANAEREVSRQRALQGGYSPNATATLAKMAREQGQAGADAMQGVEAGLVQARNQGKLAGLGGMSNIEGQRLGADLDVSKFNANARMNTDQFNTANRMAYDQSMRDNQLKALQGMTTLYGTTPGMASTFGDQLMSATGQSGTFGLGLLGHNVTGQQLPDKFQETTSKINKGIDTGIKAANTVGAITNAYNQYRTPKKKTTTVGKTSGPDLAAQGAYGGIY